MRTCALALAALFLGACGPSYVTTTPDCDDCSPEDSDDSGEPTPDPDPNDVDNDGDGLSENDGDCNDANASVSPDATDTPDDGVDQDCSGSDATSGSGGDTGSGGGDEYDLVVTYGTPAGVEVATMFAHLETIANLDEESDTYGPWGWTGRYAWTGGETVGFNPGLLQGVRLNATFCSEETEDEGHESCDNWLAYGPSEDEAHLTATVSVVYMGTSYTVDTVTFCWDNTGDGVNDECGSSGLAVFQ